MVNMGERIRELRKSKNVTQSEMSKRIGVSKAMISSYELEQRQPSYSVLIKIAFYLGVTTDYLLGVEREPSISVTGLNKKEREVITNLIDVLRNR